MTIKVGLIDTRAFEALTKQQQLLLADFLHDYYTDPGNPITEHDEAELFSMAIEQLLQALGAEGYES